MKKMRIEFSATKEIIEVTNIDTGEIYLQVPTSIFLTSGRMQQDIANYLTYGFISVAKQEALNKEPAI